MANRISILYLALLLTACIPTVQAAQDSQDVPQVNLIATTPGDICQSDRGCVLFRCEHPNAQEVEGVVTRGLPDGPSPGGTCRLAVTGTVAGRETCSGVERNAIEIRGYAWRAP